MFLVCTYIFRIFSSIKFSTSFKLYFRCIRIDDERHVYEILLRVFHKMCGVNCEIYSNLTRSEFSFTIRMKCNGKKYLVFIHYIFDAIKP